MRRAWEIADALDIHRGGGISLAWAGALAESPEEAQRIYQDMVNARTEREAMKKIDQGRRSQRW